MADRDTTPDPGLTALLERVADSGAAAARPAPAAQLRHTAEVRTYRRRLVTAAMLVLAVVAAGSFLTQGLGTSTTTPPAHESPHPQPALTQLATSDGTSQVHPLTGSELVDAESAGVLGVTWSHSTGAADAGSLTPCQPTESGSGASTEAVRLDNGVVDGPQVSHQVLAYPAVGPARAAYERAVGWFTRCTGGTDQSDARRSVVRQATSLAPVPGLDDLRIVVVRRASTGPDTWTGTVAAVMRSANRVGVLAWDLTTDDDPPALDDGFVTLTRVAATRLTAGDARSTTVPVAALLTPEDPAVRAAFDGPPQGTLPALAKVPRLDPLCEAPYDPAAPGTLDVRSPQIAGPPGIVVEFVTRYESVAVAEAAVASAVTRAESCPAANIAPGRRRALALHVSGLGDARAWSADLDASAGVGTASRQTAVLRRGDLVAYLRIDGFDAGFPDTAAESVIEAAAARLVSSG